MSDGIILRQGINSLSDNNDIQGNLNVSGNTVVGGIINGDGSGLTNIPISGTSNLQTELDGKTNNTNFTSHTGDTTIHYTKSSINLSDLGSSAHTHPISEVINLQTELDSKTDNTNFNSHTGDTTIHYTKSSINLSDLGSSAHTHSISEVINLQTELDGKVETSLFNTYTGDTETTLNGKTDNTNFNSHTGDTTIHYTKSSINLSDLGSSAHTHTLSEITDFNSYSGSVQTQIDGKVETTLFNTYTGNTQTTLNTKIETASNVGGGSGLFSGKSGTDLQFKTLTSTGATVTITDEGDTINLESAGGSAFPYTGDAEITGSLTINGDGNTPATTNFTLKNSDGDILLEVGEDSTNYVEFNDGYFQVAPTSTSNTLGTFSNQSFYIGTGIAAAGTGSVNRVYAQGQNHTLAGTANLNDSFILGTTHTIAQGNRSFVVGESINIGDVDNSFIGGNTINGSTAVLDGSFIWNAATTTMVLNDTSSGLILLGKSSFGFDGDNIVGIGGDHYSTDATLSQHYAFGDRIRGTVSRQTVIGMGTDSGTMLQLASGAANGVHLGVASNRPSFGVVKATAKSMTATATETTGLAYLGTGLPVALNVANTGDGAFWIEDVDTAPTANVANAGALYNSGGTITWWDGTTNYNLTSTGGSSLWTDNTNRLTNDTYAITELNNSTSNTYNGSYLVGNLTVGNGNTYTNGSARTVIVGLSNNISTISQADTLIAVGNGNTIRGGLYNLVVGSNHIIEGDKNTNSGDNNDIYGDENVNLGADNVIGQVATPVNNSVAIGNSNTIHGSNQLVFGSSNNLTFNNTETIPGIFFGLGYGSMPNAGFWTDPTYAAGAQPMNFSFGTQNAAREGSTIISGSGAGILYLNNTTSQVIEPTANVGDSVALWVKDRAATKAGLIIKPEDGTKHFFGDFSAIGGDETVATANKTLTIRGTGTGSGTSSLVTEDSGGNTTFEIKDDGTVVIPNVGGTTPVTNLAVDASGNVVSGTTGGGTSYWEETTSAVKIDTAETTKHVVEINTGAAAVTYGGSYSQGNLVVGDGHTFGGSSNTVRRSFIGGSSCTVGTTDSYEKSFGFGQSLTIQGDEDAVFGASNTVVGNRNFTANNGNSIYGESNSNLGESNVIGNVSSVNNNTVTIGQSLTARGDNQVLIGQSVSTANSTVKGIYFGMGDSRPSAGFFQDALLGVGLNFAIGGNQTMRSIGVIQNGSGKGIFYLNNYTGGTISEPTVDIGDSVAMWAKKRSDDVVGLLVKDESGEKSWIGGRIGVGIIDPTEALEVSGNTVVSGTLTHKDPVVSEDNSSGAISVTMTEATYPSNTVISIDPSTASNTVSYTLPAVTSGLKYTFVGKANANATGVSVTFSGPSAVVGGVISCSDGNKVISGPGAGSITNVVFSAGNFKEHTKIEFICDGTNWVITGYSLTGTASITTS